MRTLNKVILNAVSPNSTQVSAAIDSSQYYAVTIQGSVSGTSEGTLTLQGSDDVSSPTIWTDLASAAVTTASPGVVIAQPCPFQWVRASWANTSSGTGALTVTVKSIGG